ENGPAAPRAPPDARQRLLHPAARAGLRLRVHLRNLHLLPDQHPVPPYLASPARRRHRQTPRPPRATVRLAARPTRPGRLMTQPVLRLARPGQLPAPTTGNDSLQVLNDAVDQL